MLHRVGRFATPASRARFGSHLRYIPPIFGGGNTNLGFPSFLGNGQVVTVTLPPNVINNTQGFYLQWSPVVVHGGPQLSGSTDIYNAAQYQGGTGNKFRDLWNASDTQTLYYQHYLNGVGTTDFSVGLPDQNGDKLTLQWNVGTLSWDLYRGNVIDPPFSFSYNLGPISFDTVTITGPASNIIARSPIPGSLPL